MSRDNRRESEIASRPRFGLIAVQMGFISGTQLKEALNDQIDDNLAGKTHRFLGDILLSKKWITLEQVDIILDEIFKEEMRMKGKL